MGMSTTGTSIRSLSLVKIRVFGLAQDIAKNAYYRCRSSLANLVKLSLRMASWLLQVHFYNAHGNTLMAVINILFLFPMWGGGDYPLKWPKLKKLLNKFIKSHVST
jgi:hypothetical protein